jgi:23S rRNA-/tRNA-specific pseudouridylate synthase
VSAAVPAALGGMRLDQALARIFPQYSRNRLQAWLESGHITIDGRRLSAKRPVTGGEEIVLRPPRVPDAAAPRAQKMPLKVVHEDAELIVIDKPAGLVVHPGAGQPDRTLLNALLAHAPALAGVPRAGIVHRLDKDTSGLLVVAKTLEAQTELVRQLAARTMRRLYLAVVQGDPPASGAARSPGRAMPPASAARRPLPRPWLRARRPRVRASRRAPHRRRCRRRRRRAPADSRPSGRHRLSPGRARMPHRPRPIAPPIRACHAPA